MTAMNDDQLADLLNQQLNALFEGKMRPSKQIDLREPSATEFDELLQVAQNLTVLAPPPRPEFESTLKASLLQMGSSSSDLPNTSTGGTFTPKFILLAAAATTIALLGIALLIGLDLFGSEPTTDLTPEPTSLPSVQPQIAPLISPSPDQPPPTSASTPTVLPNPTVTHTATIPVPTSTSTPIIDLLPPITVTIETTEPLPPPPELVPGDSNSAGSSNQGDGNGNSGGGNDGDHDRGHGNDADGHDEDNPGGKKN